MKNDSPLPMLDGRRAPRFALVLLALMLVPRLGLAVESRTGEQIYKQQCASCHGAAGEGSADYPRALAGDRSVNQLARLIAKTMPEDDPGTCLGEDAENVSAYIYQAFYSTTAQNRGKPARIELSRLTVRQYRNAVADLIETFRTPGNWDDRRGLHGEYFKSRRFRASDRVIDRLDPEVRFEFGENGPDPEKFEPSEFSIRWEGSVLAPETGEYEFNVRTEHATRLWLNDLNRPLIDAWVKSGTDTDHRATITLLGGRVYPLRLEFSKAKQGVDDSKEKKKQAPKVNASIVLEWALPHRPAEVVPRRNLSPSRVPETFVVAAPFPPDDRSVGYERGTSISKAWDQATTDGAIEVAGSVVSRLRELSGIDNGDSDRSTKLRAFCRRFAERAFRRPLTDEQMRLFIDRPFETAPDPDTAVKRVVLLVLKSPRFLYRELGGGAPDAYDVAARLSFTLWDSLPDQELLKEAEGGRLATREQVARQAERMVPGPRTRSKLREFFLQWLKVDAIPDVAKDPGKFPDFTEAIASDLRTSLDLFLEDVIWGQTSDFRQLLLSDQLYLNGRLAMFYGADLPPDAGFQKVSQVPGERAGVLTHPYLMASFAYTETSSPIHRGVFIARSILGRSLRPPPVAVAPLAPDLHASLTTRERVTIQTGLTACQTCHAMINPLGFPLERYDAVGRYRNQEKARAIDATGTYQTRSGETQTFSGVRDLAAFLAGSEETRAAVVEQIFQYLVKQPIRAYGPNALAQLEDGFVRHDYRVRDLLVEIAAASALTPRD